VRVFSATVGAPITAVALSTALLEKSVPHLPRLAAAADSPGVLHPNPNPNPNPTLTLTLT